MRLVVDFDKEPYDKSKVDTSHSYYGWELITLLN
jgi:hypothetical protein